MSTPSGRRASPATDAAGILDPKSPSRFRGAAAFLFLAALAATLAFRDLVREPYNSDEGMWIRRAQTEWALVRAGDWDHPAWGDFEATWGWVNPAVGKLILGASLDGFDRSWEWAPGLKPPDDVLFAARFPAAVFGALGVVAIFALGRSWLRPDTAFLAGLLLAISPVWLSVARHAMTDVFGSSLGLASLSVFAFAWSRRSGRVAGALLGILLAGVLSGLAVGAKLNAVTTPFALGLVVCWALVAPVRGAPAGTAAHRRFAVIAGVLFAAGSVVALVASNPYLHHDAYTRFREMVHWWTEMYATHAERARTGVGPGTFLPEESGTRILLGKMFCPLRAGSLVLLAPVAAVLLARRVARGPERDRLVRLVGWIAAIGVAVPFAAQRNQIVHPWILWAALLGGVGILAASFNGVWKRATPMPAVPLLLAAIVVIAVTWSGTYLSRSRYYAPILPYAAIAAGAALAALRRDLKISGFPAPRQLFDAAILLTIAAVALASPDASVASVSAMHRAESFAGRIPGAASALALLASVLLAAGRLARPVDPIPAGP